MTERSINGRLSVVEPPHLMPNQFQSMVLGPSTVDVHRQEQRAGTMAPRTPESMSRKLELMSQKLKLFRNLPMVWSGNPIGTTL